MTTAIRTSRLRKSFGTLRAVDDLSLTIAPGTVYGFLGPNGSGKTTTIRLLLGLLPLDHGEACVLGHDVSRDADAVRSRCGALLEHDGLYERLTVETNLDVAGRLWRMDRTARHARTREVLEQLGLYDRRHDTVGEWSRGMKRKLAVARALYHRPAVVFLDEPTSGLDPAAAAELIEELRAVVHTDRTTVFLTTHNLSEAEKLCDRVGVIREGALVAEGTPDEIRSLAGGRRLEIVAREIDAPHVHAVARLPGVRESVRTSSGLRLTLDEEASSSPIVRYLVTNGVAVEEVRKGSASLEEAFLALIEAREGGGYGA
jgi:ABC-2 type transport system ATP-binding protein